MEILKKAAELEDRPGLPNRRVIGWEAAQVHASKVDIDRLVGEQLLEVVRSAGGGRPQSYRLTPSGQALVALSYDAEERRTPDVSADEILEALDLVVGYDDLKAQLATSLARRNRTHFLFEGPPACAKSIILDAIRVAVPETEMAFGSSTSAAGLSDLLFEKQPYVLLLDEIDKMRSDTLSVLLGLMETGEVREVKSGKTRGIKLHTTVIAAGNDTSRLPREIRDRTWELTFAPYTRDEFVEVCQVSLRREGIEGEVPALVAGWVFDYQLGSVREVRRHFNEMIEPTEAEAKRVLNLRLKYSKNPQQRRRSEAPTARMPGM